MEDMVGILFDYGSLGIFAVFLIWQHLSMQKRFDALVDKFQGQLAEIHDKGESAEDKLRERYDSVIKQYQDDATSFRSDVASNVEKSIRKIEELNRELDQLPFETIQIQIESLSLAHRNSHILLEKVVDFMNKNEEEERLKQMARKLNRNEDE